MSYNKQTWSNGDTITSEKLNHLEGGVEANSLPDITLQDDHKLLGVAQGSYALIDAEYGYGQSTFILDVPAESNFSVSPAVIQLEDGIEYTFRFTDEFHPDGIVISRYAYVGKTALDWYTEIPGSGNISRFSYFISYVPDTNETRASASYEDPNDLGSTCFFATSITQCTNIHKIPTLYLESELPTLNPDTEAGQFVGVGNDPDGMKYVLVPNPAEYGTILWNDGSPTGDLNYTFLRLQIANNSWVYLSHRYMDTSGGIFNIKTHVQFTRVVTDSAIITGIELYDIEVGPGGAMTGTLYTKTFA